MYILKVNLKVKEIINGLYNYLMRARLKNNNFSIISNNCWGGRVYQDLGLPYATPFVGLFLFAPDYIKLLRGLKYYLCLELNFDNYSKYIDCNNIGYPIGFLGDIEIHFMHYSTEKEAKEKWERRLKRINWDNLFVKFNDRDGCTKYILEEFDQLPIANKVSFTAHNHDNLKHSVWFKEYQNKECVEPELQSYKRYFDVVSWLNTGRIVKIKMF